MTSNKLFHLTWLVVLVTCISCYVAYYWLDRSIVLYFAVHHTRNLIWVVKLAPFADILSGFLRYGAFPGYLYLGLRFAYSRSFTTWEKNLLIFLTMDVIAYFVIGSGGYRNLLGRAWPDTWTHNNLSFLKNNVYGFFPAFRQQWSSSFPSGHAILAAVFAVFAWNYLPRLRLASICYAVFVMAMMLIQYFHFLSDIIAGAAIGFLVANYVCFYVNHAVKSV